MTRKRTETTLQIDLKHHVTDTSVYGNKIQIIKTTNGQAIPDHEPLVLFRGRDYLALPLLKHYRELCHIDGATDYQLESVDELIALFENFKEEHPETMKQPGITRGA